MLHLFFADKEGHMLWYSGVKPQKKPWRIVDTTDEM